MVQLDGESLIDLVGCTANDDASSGGVGFEHLQIVRMREVGHLPEFGRVGAVGGGEVLVGNVVDAGQGRVLKIVQSFHGFPSRVSAKDKGSSNYFIGVGGFQLFISGRMEMFAVGERDVVFGQVGLPAFFLLLA